jgi:multimeric flavodoxin WrbA
MSVKKLILHDLDRERFDKVLKGKEATEFSALPRVASCLGCFSCWVKTPGTCVIKDRATIFPRLLSYHDELIVVSRLVFGGYSPEIKAVLERSLSYLLPFFKVRDGISVHDKRGARDLVLRNVFYGEGTGEAVCLAEKITLANSRNLGASSHESRYFPNLLAAVIPC